MNFLFPPFATDCERAILVLYFITYNRFLQSQYIVVISGKTTSEPGKADKMDM